MENKKVLITGIAGLLGSRLADWIIENTDYHVVGVDDLSGGYLENVNQEATFHNLNLITDVDRFDLLLAYNKFDYVFHFAAYAAEGLSPFIRNFNYQNNLVATANVVNSCVKYEVKRLVFTSTMAVYGDGEIPFSEESPYKPIDPYGIAKMGCELDIKLAGEQFGLDWCIIRPHNVYGIKQNIWDKYRNVLGIWMYQYLNGEPMTIFGDGKQKRAFSYIDDSLEPLWKSAILPEASKEIINLGGIHHCTIKQANAVLREVIGGGETVYLEGRHEAKFAYPTWQKSVDILGFEHKTDLKKGLKKMWNWAKQQPMRDRFLWDNYEIEKGIYSYWK